MLLCRPRCDQVFSFLVGAPLPFFLLLPSSFFLFSHNLTLAKTLGWWLLAGLVAVLPPCRGCSSASCSQPASQPASQQENGRRRRRLGGLGGLGWQEQVQSPYGRWLVCRSGRAHGDFPFGHASGSCGGGLSCVFSQQTMVWCAPCLLLSGCVAPHCLLPVVVVVVVAPCTRRSNKLTW